MENPEVTEEDEELTEAGKEYEKECKKEYADENKPAEAPESKRISPASVPISPSELVTFHTHNGDYRTQVLSRIESVRIYELFKDIVLTYQLTLPFALKDTSGIELYKKFENICTMIFSNGYYTYAKYRNSFINIEINDLSNTKSMKLMICSPNINEFEQAFEEITEHIKDIIDDEVPRMSINWYYTSSEGKTKVSYFSEELNETFFSEAYPYVDMEKFVDAFLNSEEPILILIGPPGTGKTRFIRYIMKNIVKKYSSDTNGPRCLYSSDKKIIETGSIFMDFIDNSGNKILVMEDVDYHLRPRTDGNSSMYNLLSVSNGIVVNFLQKKKIILSTNLPNTTKMDEALLRPGRCFDVLKMRLLNKKESENFLELFDIKLSMEDKKYTLADLYRIINTGKQEEEKPKGNIHRKAGF